MTDIKYTPFFKELSISNHTIENNGYVFKVNKCIISECSKLFKTSLEMEHDNTFVIPDRFSLRAVDYILCHTPFQSNCECAFGQNSDFSIFNMDIRMEITYNILELFNYLEITYNTKVVLGKLFDLLFNHISADSKKYAVDLTKLVQVVKMYEFSKNSKVTRFFMSCVELPEYNRCYEQLLQIVPRTTLISHIRMLHNLN